MCIYALILSNCCVIDAILPWYSLIYTWMFVYLLHSLSRVDNLELAVSSCRVRVLMVWFNLYRYAISYALMAWSLFKVYYSDAMIDTLSSSKLIFILNSSICCTDLFS